mmetsp:Transcript_6436/g.20436  ORF Transcript_6436/g.20436 Transcript_6436/m.20436 type:complete len:263 (+) Transcript_6436:1021-1809(+)
MRVSPRSPTRPRCSSTTCPACRTRWLPRTAAAVATVASRTGGRRRAALHPAALRSRSPWRALGRWRWRSRPSACARRATCPRASGRWASLATVCRCWWRCSTGGRACGCGGTTCSSAARAASASRSPRWTSPSAPRSPAARWTGRSSRPRRRWARWAWAARYGPCRSCSAGWPRRRLSASGASSCLPRPRRAAGAWACWAASWPRSALGSSLRPLLRWSACAPCGKPWLLVWSAAVPRGCGRNAQARARPWRNTRKTQGWMS